MKNSKTTWNTFQRKLKDEHYINKLKKFTKVSKKSFEELVPELDCEGGFFYVDPPYFGKSKLYGYHNLATTILSRTIKKII